MAQSTSGNGHAQAPTVFFSYADRDEGFIRDLLAATRFQHALGCKVITERSIAVGSREEETFKLIAGADAFIAFISGAYAGDAKKCSQLAQAIQGERSFAARRTIAFLILDADGRLHWQQTVLPDVVKFCPDPAALDCQDTYGLAPGDVKDAELNRKIDSLAEQLRNMLAMGPGSGRPLPPRPTEFDELKLSFRRNFDRCVERIDVLSARKDLHDQLHNLQMEFYVPVAEIIQRDDLDGHEAELVREHAFKLGEIIEKTQLILDKKILDRSDGEWLPKVCEALQTLEAGLQTADLVAARKAVARVERVLKLYPSQINTKLNVTARELALAGLAAELRLLCSMSDSLAEKVGDKAQQLEGLHDRISGLASVHDDWQSFDNELNLLEADLKQEMGDLQDSWPFLKEKAKTLYATRQEQWARLLVHLGGQMEAALAQKRNDAAQQFFVRYRSAARKRFYVADQELKQGCQELQQIGARAEDILIHLGGVR